MKDRFTVTLGLHYDGDNGNGNLLKKDFKYLGAWMESSAKDIKQRKAAAWRACSKLNKISFWQSSLARKIKLRLFAATVESVLLYAGR